MQVLLAKQWVASPLCLLGPDGNGPVKIGRPTVGHAGLGCVQRGNCSGCRHLDTSEDIAGEGWAR